MAGGASRGDVWGQVIVRSAAALFLTVAVLFGDRPDIRRSRTVGIYLMAMLTLTLIQLCNLPPALWHALPDRAIFNDGSATNGQLSIWRPLSIVPSATINACVSLIVPITTWVLFSGLKPTERRYLPGFILILITASVFVGLLQFSGVYLDNPLVNDSMGQVSGLFANRNHFAVLIALGCLLAPVWAFQRGRQSHWRAPVALGLGILFILMQLASGSRTGLILGLLALIIGAALVKHRFQMILSKYPRWVFPTLIIVMVLLITSLVFISISAGRAVSIDRIVGGDPGQDMRTRGLRTVLSMVSSYFPFGSGLGTFDPVFRVQEPFLLLKPTYFNHAHNDWLEVVLDAGLLGLLMLVAAVTWWGRASVRAWQSGSGSNATMARLGSAFLLLVMLASLFDYPARTPMIMALVVIAAMWLSDPYEIDAGGPSLPAKGR